MSYSTKFVQSRKTGNTVQVSKSKRDPNKQPVGTVFKPGFGYPDQLRLDAVNVAQKFGKRYAARNFGVALSTIYRWIDALGMPALNKNTGYGNTMSTRPLRNHARFKEEDRLVICRFAMEYDVQAACKLFNASDTSVYSWLKTYNMQTGYWNKNLEV
jgi:hypothetical protein